MEKSNVYLYVAELAVKSSFALSARYRHFFEGEKGKLLFEKLSEDEQRLILSDIQHYTVNSLNEEMFERMVRRANAHWEKQLDARKWYHSRPFKTVKDLADFYAGEDCLKLKS